MKFDAVIFDMDGTLLDTIEDLTDSVNHAMTVCGHEAHSIERVKDFVGNGARRLIEQALGGNADTELIEQGLSAFKTHYNAHGTKTRPYAGILELLHELKDLGIKTAVVSNKFHAAVVPTSEKHFGSLMDIAIGESSEIRRKPAPDTVLKAMNDLGVSKERCVYIGDSEVDIATAKNAGIPCISVTWGYREESYLREVGGNIFAHSTDELRDILFK